MIVSRLLFGLANPSGKLPVTSPRAENDLPASTPLQWPGVEQEDGSRRVEYSEKLEIGYRWFDAQGIEPLFPFGLSDTGFELPDFSVSPTVVDGSTPVEIPLRVGNTGDRRGAEVPQVYLGFPERAGEPPKRLVGFEKAWLDPGESREITVVIDPETANHPFDIYNAQARRWERYPEKYGVMVDTSSEDIHYVGQLTVRLSGR